MLVKNWMVLTSIPPIADETALWKRVFQRYMQLVGAPDNMLCVKGLYVLLILSMKPRVA